MEEYAYFMVLVRRPLRNELDGPLTGVVEHLGTGEKRRFGSAEELVRFVGGRQEEKLGLGSRPGNTKG